MTARGSSCAMPARERAVAKMVSRVAVAFALEARAQAIEASVRDDRIMPHSRQLPSAVEMAEAAFAARQLRTAAGDLLAGLEE